MAQSQGDSETIINQLDLKLPPAWGTSQTMATQGHCYIIGLPTCREFWAVAHLTYVQCERKRNAWELELSIQASFTHQCAQELQGERVWLTHMQARCKLTTKEGPWVDPGNLHLSTAIGRRPWSISIPCLVEVALEVGDTYDIHEDQCQWGEKGSPQPPRSFGVTLGPFSGKPTFLFFF